jgi:hypothetical protein
MFLDCFSHKIDEFFTRQAALVGRLDVDVFHRGHHFGPAGVFFLGKLYDLVAKPLAEFDTGFVALVPGLAMLRDPLGTDLLKHFLNILR